MHVVVVLGQTVVRGRLDVGQADAIVAEVELGVVAADEDVTEDPQRSGRRRDVEAEEAAQADCVAQLRYLHRASHSYACSQLYVSTESGASSSDSSRGYQLTTQGIILRSPSCLRKLTAGKDSCIK